MPKTAISVLAIVYFTCLAPCMSEDSSGAVFQRDKDVNFSDVQDNDVKMDIFVPTGKKNGIAIIDIVNSGFKSRRRELEGHEKAKLFDIACRRGYTVFAIRTGAVSKFGGSEMVRHIREGVQWVREHADEYDVDADRIGIMGASTGGYLACLTALTGDQESGVLAVAAFYPITDFLDFGGAAIDVKGKGKIASAIQKLVFPDGLEGLSDEQVTEQLRQQSPQHLVHDKSPPFLFIHGDEDFIVPLVQSKRMHNALVELGVDSQLIVKEGGGHAWPTLYEELEMVFDWFDEKLAEKGN